MDKISKNAAKEYYDNLCVCYSDDRKTALITTKTDAIKHANAHDTDKYIHSTVKSNFPYLSRALKVNNTDYSQVAWDFVSQYTELSKCRDICSVYDSPNHKKREAEGNEIKYINNNIRSSVGSITITDPELKQIQQNSQVDLGLRPETDVIKDLERRMNKI